MPRIHTRRVYMVKLPEHGSRCSRLTQSKPSGCQALPGKQNEEASGSSEVFLHALCSLPLHTPQDQACQAPTASNTAQEPPRCRARLLVVSHGTCVVCLSSPLQPIIIILANLGSSSSFGKGVGHGNKRPPYKHPCLTSALSTCTPKQSILEYNGGACVAMVGKNCVAIAR